MNQAVQTGLRSQALRTRVGEAWAGLRLRPSPRLSARELLLSSQQQIKCC